MISIVYDATYIANSFKKDANRSGIFFVAKSILDELIKRNNIDIYLYISPEKARYFEKIKTEFYPKLKYIQDFTKQKKVIKLNQLFWALHKKFYTHKYLRKPFAFGILATQYILNQLCKNNYNTTEIKKMTCFFSPGYLIPNFINKNNIPVYLLLHDAIPYMFPTINSKKWLVKDFEKRITKNNFFFCVSNQTKEDYKKIIPMITNENSMVVTLAANEKFQKKEDLTLLDHTKIKYSIPTNKKYIFSLCNIEPRKNLIRAVRTFVEFIHKNKINDLIWVMGGGQWDSFIEELEKQNIKWDTSLIIKAGYIDDEDLPVLYSNAEWFVYTSQYEGFGLPPLEAMQCGCPVITSNNSSLPEVVGDAGLMIDWDSDEQHIEAYEKYYFNKALRQENSLKGIERAKLFSWENTVDLMVEQMRKAIS